MRKVYLKCKLLVVVLIIMIFSTFSPPKFLNGQNNIDSFKIDFVYYKNQKYVKEIHFVDKEKGKVAASFNIIENNPYQNIQYPVLRESRQGYNVFKIDDIRIKEIELNGPTFVHAEILSDTFKIIDGAIKSYHQLLFTDTSHIILKYHLNLYMGDGLVGVSNTIYIFRKNGELLKKYDQFNTQCLFPCVTSDSKYFAYSFGGVVDESLVYFADLGYHIIDLSNGETIVNKKVDKKYHNVGITNDSTLIRVECNDMDSCKFIIYDLANFNKYEKVYPINKRGLLRQITSNGLIFIEDINNPLKYRLDRYKTDFYMEDIK